MNAIAHKLGVTAPALYRHIDDLDDVLRRATRSLLSEIPADDGSPATWQEWLIVYAYQLRDVLLRHHEIAARPRLAGRTGSVSLDLVNRIHEVMIQNGFDERAASRGFKLLAGVVLFCVRDQLLEEASPTGEHPQLVEVKELLRNRAPDELGTLRRVSSLAPEANEVDAQFRLAVDCVLRGLEHQLVQVQGLMAREHEAP